MEPFKLMSIIDGLEKALVSKPGGTSTQHLAVRTDHSVKGIWHVHLVLTLVLSKGFCIPPCFAEDTIVKIIAMPT